MTKYIRSTVPIDKQALPLRYLPAICFICFTYPFNVSASSNTAFSAAPSPLTILLFVMLVAMLLVALLGLMMLYVKVIKYKVVLEKLGIQYEWLAQSTNSSIWRYNIGLDEICFSPQSAELAAWTQDTSDDAISKAEMISSQTLEKFISRLHQPDRAKVQADIEKCVLDGREVRHFFSLKTAERTAHYLQTVKLVNDANHLYLVGVVRNIEELKRAECALVTVEEELLQHRKNDSVMSASSNLAHKFNNVLALLLGYTELALAGLDVAHPSFRRMELVLKAAQEIKLLVASLRAMGKESSEQDQLVNLTEFSERFIKLISPTLPENVSLDLHDESQGVEIEVDSVTLHSIYIQLCSNACLAMAEFDGRVQIALKTNPLDSTVVIAFTDAGAGMSGEVLERALERFYTTRSEQGASGMGLYEVAGHVRGLGGTVKVSSVLDVGTTVEVTLPCRKELNEEGKQIALSKLEKTALASRGASKRAAPVEILVVDDETDIVLLVGDILLAEGFRVTCFSCSEEALAHFTVEPERYQLIIADMTMPRITGLDLAEKVHDICPSARTIIMTGHDDDISEERKQHCGVQLVLTKPMTTMALLSAVGTALS